jgi:uncharacterized protein YecE (DUF72 family)
MCCTFVGTSPTMRIQKQETECVDHRVALVPNMSNIREGLELPPNSLSTIRIGIGGWTYEPWRGAFYPEGLTQKRELEYASRKLTSIEVNGTYYGAQKPETFAKWHDETPDDFVFALKGPRFTTNRRVLAEAGESIERFFTSGVTQLKDKLGPINWQFAPTKQFDADDFGAFLRRLPVSVDGLNIRHVVEVRHASFRSPDFLALVREHGVAVVIAADSEYPQIADITGSFVYARIMGTTNHEPLGYSDHAIHRWSQRAKTWASGGYPEDLETVAVSQPDAPGRDVFLYVISGFKERNPSAAMSIMERVS